MAALSMTREERYLLNLYEYLQEKGVSSCSSHAIAERIGLTERQLKNTLRTLTSINFIKKMNSSEILITQNGLELVEKLKKS